MYPSNSGKQLNPGGSMSGRQLQSGTIRVGPMAGIGQAGAGQRRPIFFQQEHLQQEIQGNHGGTSSKPVCASDARKGVLCRSVWFILSAFSSLSLAMNCLLTAKGNIFFWPLQIWISTFHHLSIGFSKTKYNNKTHPAPGHSSCEHIRKRLLLMGVWGHLFS